MASQSNNPVPILSNPKQTNNSPKAAIPPAPSSQAAAIGAPTASNTMTQASYGTHFTSIEDFLGEKIDTPFPSPPLSPSHAERRKNWLPTFLLQGGLNKLLALIESLSNFTQIENQMSENTKRIAKKCLCAVMQCVKILLSCSFCANSVD